MTQVRHTALCCCLLSTVAGLIRTFWPENIFKAIINVTLALYIIAAVLQAAQTADRTRLWNEIFMQIQPTLPAAQAEDYREQLTLEASAEAIREILHQSDIEAVVSVRSGTLHVTLLRGRDCSRAEALLRENCGTLQYTIAVGAEP